jgi:hypothetical protein
MNKEFIPYEQALELKELGFDEPCMAFYEPGNEEVQIVGVEQRYNDPKLLRLKDFCAPLYQQAFRWFREKYGLYADLFVDDDQTFGFCVSSFAEEGRCRLDRPIKRQFSTYEESELECIKFLIEIVERKPEAYS